MTAIQLLLLILLVLLLVGTVPAWPYATAWGYGPSGLMLILLVVLVILIMTGRL
jgi:hypothetical protein